VSVTLYFAKVNINSHIHQVYKDKSEFDRIIKKIYVSVVDDIYYVKENIGTDEEGNRYEKEDSYKFHSIEKFDKEMEFTITGRVVKKMKIFINNLNESTGELIKVPTEHSEIIEFHYDLYKERIAFYTSNRFGYVDFVDVFQELLNKATSVGKEKFYFDVALLKQGMDVGQIKKELKKIGKLETLRIEVNPPNPDDELLDSIQKNGEEYLDNYKVGNITNRSILFTSKAPEGLNIDSAIINEELEQIDRIHSKLSSKEAVGKSYVQVDAMNKKGRSFTTKNTNPVKDKLEKKPESLYEFAIECKKKIIPLISSMF